MVNKIAKQNETKKHTNTTSKTNIPLVKTLVKKTIIYLVKILPKKKKNGRSHTRPQQKLPIRNNNKIILDRQITPKLFTN